MFLIAMHHEALVAQQQSSTNTCTSIVVTMNEGYCDSS